MSKKFLQGLVFAGVGFTLSATEGYATACDSRCLDKTSSCERSCRNNAENLASCYHDCQGTFDSCIRECVKKEKGLNL